jgi:stalled ribosome alternative rescue factor ArfA
MSHGKREQAKFRAGSLQRKAKNQATENKAFEAETEKIIKQIRGEDERRTNSARR